MDHISKHPGTLGRGLLSGQPHPHGHLSWHLQKMTPLFQTLALGPGTVCPVGSGSLQLICPCPRMRCAFVLQTVRTLGWMS